MCCAPFLLIKVAQNIHFNRLFKENQSFGLCRKLGRAEVLSKGIKHMEIYGQFIYIGWK